MPIDIYKLGVISHLSCRPCLREQRICTCIMSVYSGRKQMTLYIHPILYYGVYKIHPITCQSRQRRGVNILSGPDGGGWPASRPRHFTPGKETRYSLYKRLGRPRRWNGQVRKISASPGFKPRNVQPVACRYTN